MKRGWRTVVAAAMAIAATSWSGSAAAEPRFEVVTRGDVTLQPLNPLRGDASPKAGVLWGDIKRNVATGALIEFVEGFSSPPHIHNITYRAVVISGRVHNDDPDAAVMWMGPGSYWSQPAGETHVTSAPAEGRSVAFLETLAGPYLVRPSREAFDVGERPVNVEARNVVWLAAADVAWIDGPAVGGDTGPEIAFLWGAPQPKGRHGSFLRLPPGYAGVLRGGEAWLRAVLVQGRARHRISGKTDAATLDPGSYVGATGGLAHALQCVSARPCLFYVSATGRYRLTAAPSAD